MPAGSTDIGALRQFSGRKGSLFAEGNDDGCASGVG
jgi:hypothetical protein